MNTTEFFDKYAKDMIIAAKHYSENAGLSWEDIYQEMILAILEKAQVNPTLLENTPAYVIQLAYWRAQDTARREFSETNHTVELDSSLALPTDDVDMDASLQVLTADLDPIQQQVASMLLDGTPVYKIGKNLGMSSRKVNTIIASMRQRFSSAAL